MGSQFVQQMHVCCFTTLKMQVISKVLILQVASRFVGSFQCDQKCGHLQDDDQKTQCEQQFCEQLNDDEYADYYEDN